MVLQCRLQVDPFATEKRFSSCPHPSFPRSSTYIDKVASHDRKKRNCRYLQHWLFSALGQQTSSCRKCLRCYEDKVLFLQFVWLPVFVSWLIFPWMWTNHTAFFKTIYWLWFLETMSYYSGVTAEVATVSFKHWNSLSFFWSMEKWPSYIVPNLIEQSELRSNMRKFRLKKLH